MAVDLHALNNGAPTMALISHDGRIWTMGSTPEQATAGGFEWAWVDVPRQGQKKLSYLGAPNSKTLSLTTLVFSPHGTIETLLLEYQQLAGLGQWVRVANGGVTEAGWWRIKSLTWVVQQRDALQKATQAQVTWSFEEADIDNTPAIGRTRVANVSANTKGRTYTVKAGDTLYSIAQTQLGDGTRWVEIATLNNLAGSQSSTFNEQVPSLPAGSGSLNTGEHDASGGDPAGRTALKPGTVLNLPPR